MYFYRLSAFFTANIAISRYTNIRHQFYTVQRNIFYAQSIVLNYMLCHCNNLKFFNLFIAPLTKQGLKCLRDQFYKCSKNRLAQNACTQKDPLEIAMCRPRIEEINHVFTYKIDNEAKPVCDQKSTGRCWNFAAHNVMRLPFMKQYNLEEFEFSQAYFFYWDKIERSYYFLNNIVETAKRGEKVDGRLVSFLLGDPVSFTVFNK